MFFLNSVESSRVVPPERSDMVTVSGFPSGVIR